MATGMNSVLGAGRLSQAACLQDAPSQWRRKAAHHSSQTAEKCRGGKHLEAGVLIQHRRGEGQEVESLKLPLPRSWMPSISSLPKGTFQASSPGPLRSVGPAAHSRPPENPSHSPGRLPPSLVLLLRAFAPPPPFKPWSCSPNAPACRGSYSLQPTSLPCPYGISACQSPKSAPR